MKFHKNDGGRREYDPTGRKIRGRSDCVARAVAIGTGETYKYWYHTLSWWSRRYDGKRNASTGIYTTSGWFRRLMQEAGWRWVASPRCVYFCAEELGKNLPNDRTIICRVYKLGRRGGHYATVINGVTHDTWNASDPYRWTRGGRGKIVLDGYWEHESNEPWDGMLDKDTKDEGYD